MIWMGNAKNVVINVQHVQIHLITAKHALLIEITNLFVLAQRVHTISTKMNAKLVLINANLALLTAKPA
jgi:hypothetical protein